MKNGERTNSLHALRGYVSTARKSHKQAPPPDRALRPYISGLSWVNLVFPFFLFSMGAAIPIRHRDRWRYDCKAINKQPQFIDL